MPHFFPYHLTPPPVAGSPTEPTVFFFFFLSSDCTLGLLSPQRASIAVCRAGPWQKCNVLPLVLRPLDLRSSAFLSTNSPGPSLSCSLVDKYTKCVPPAPCSRLAPFSFSPLLPPVFFLKEGFEAIQQLLFLFFPHSSSFIYPESAFSCQFGGCPVSNACCGPFFLAPPFFRLLLFAFLFPFFGPFNGLFWLLTCLKACVAPRSPPVLLKKMFAVLFFLSGAILFF